jgi:hypothetical protein
MTPSVTFPVTVWETRPGVTGFEIPVAVVERLGSGKRPPVKVSLNGYTYESTIAVYGDQYLLPLSKENREAAGVEAGQEIELTLELDDKPRVYPIPDDLKTALSNVGVLEKFEKMAPSHRKEWIRNIEEAKAPETRERRIEKCVEALS